MGCRVVGRSPSCQGHSQPRGPSECSRGFPRPADRRVDRTPADGAEAVSERIMQLPYRPDRIRAWIGDDGPEVVYIPADRERALVEALLRYGEHRVECAVNTAPPNRRSCDCGWAEQAAALPPQEPTEPTEREQRRQEREGLARIPQEPERPRPESASFKPLPQEPKR